VTARYRVNHRREVEFVVEGYDRRLPLVIDPVLSYSTYFGSGSGDDTITAVAVDAAGNAYVAGNTSAADLPTTPGVLQPVASSGGAFVAKFNPAGTDLLDAPHLGGRRSYIIKGPGRGWAGQALLKRASPSPY